MDPAWLVAAFGVGLGAAGLAMLLTGEGRSRPKDPLRLTATWRLDELDRPTIVARDLAGLEVPSGAQVLATGRVEGEVVRRVPARRIPDTPAEFALAGDGQRALLFLGGLRPGAFALPTTDPQLLERLRVTLGSLERQATPYAERRRVADLAGEPGLPVEAEGVVKEVLPRAGAHIVRLEQDGHVAAVRAAQVPDGLVGRRVAVRGRLGRDASGYPVVEADEIRPLP
jgi:hypothetical protein